MSKWLRKLLGVAANPVGNKEPAGMETATILHVATGSHTARQDEAELEAIVRLEALVSDTVRANKGAIIQIFNGECWAAFTTAPAAVRAAHAISLSAASQRAQNWFPPVACGIHTGPVYVHEGRYYGSPINTAARIHVAGREVVLTESAAALVVGQLPGRLRLLKLEGLALQGRSEPLQIFALSEQRLGIFVSYRRESGSEAARLVKEEMERRGASVFLDLDALKSHHFDDRLCREIESAANFVLILSPGCLDRCAEQGDWLRKEISHAIHHERNIVPVFTEGFEFPTDKRLPAELADLPRHNGVRYSHEYFRAAMEKLWSFLVEEAGQRSA
jgi:class 3 adenylate cyclase